MSEQKHESLKLNRRALMRAGAGLVTGSTLASLPAPAGGEGAKPAEYVRARLPTAWLKQHTVRGGDETAIGGGGPTGSQHRLSSLINQDEGLANARLDGRAGWQILIKEPGYRGIPLWAVKAIDLRIDGTPVAEDDIVFLLNNVRYRIADLQKQVGAQWWVFDWATLFVPKEGGLADGEHEVEVKMTYISMYGSDGSTTSVAAKQRMSLRKPEIG